LNINSENVSNELHLYKEKNLILENQEDLSKKKIREQESDSKSLLETKANEISKLKETKSVLESIIREKETCEKDFVEQIENLRSGAKKAEDLGVQASSSTSEKLGRLEKELADRKEEISKLSGNLNTKNTEVISLLRKIEVVETEKAELEARLGKIKSTDAANETNQANELESPIKTDEGSMFGGPPSCTVHSPRIPEVKNIDTAPARSPTGSGHLIPIFEEKQIMAEKINT
jgi:DNA repair exonuclease SbcCD ATPase subunit